jgi:hypothetical protein
MPRFRQEEVLLCPITFINEVEADHVGEATRLFNEANERPDTGVRMVSRKIGAPIQRSVSLPELADDGNRPTTGDRPETGETQQTSTGEQPRLEL